MKKGKFKISRQKKHEKKKEDIKIEKDENEENQFKKVKHQT